MLVSTSPADLAWLEKVRRWLDEHTCGRYLQCVCAFVSVAVAVTVRELAVDNVNELLARAGV